MNSTVPQARLAAVIVAAVLASSGHAAPAAAAEPASVLPTAPPAVAVSVPATTTQAKPTMALAAAKALTVKGRAPKTGYERAKFGSGWVDINQNGCDTRNDILATQLTKVKKSGKCKVTAGILTKDPYTAKRIVLKTGSGSNIQIDHVVALSDAWQKGAQNWPWAKRVAFANDPLNLLAVDAKTNMSKGDGDTATWLPPNKAYRCDYVARQVAVKTKYGVWATKAEQAAMVKVLKTCPTKKLPAFGSQPTTAKNTGGAGPKSTSTPKPTGKTDPQFSSCAKAKAAGYGPYVKGKDPEYNWYTDGDKDGTVCE